MSDSPVPFMPAEQPRKRRRKWFRRIAVTVFVSLCSYFAWLFIEREWTRRDGERALATAHARVEQSDPNWTWEKLNAARPRPPAGKNGADLIPRVKKHLPGDWTKEFGKDEWKPLLDPAPNVRFSPRVIEHVRDELGRVPEAVALARGLRDCPFGYREITLLPNVLDTPLRDTQDTRAVVNLLRWSTVRAVEDGDRGAAVNDLRALLGASRSIGDEPFLISQLVRLAGRSITVQTAEWVLGQFDDLPGLVDLERALAADAEEPLFLYGVRGDRAAFDRLFENMQAGAVSLHELGGAQKAGDWERLGWWHYRAKLPGDRAFAFEWMTRYVEAAQRPIHEQPPLFAEIPEPPKDPQLLLSGLLLPAVSIPAHAHWRTTALERCAVVGIACERYRQQHKRWPGALNELVPVFLPVIPLDPYDSQPLRYAKSTDGIAIYSVGKPRPSRVGSPPQVTAPKPGLPDGIEFGFRLWNPDKRHLPPLPDPPPGPPDEPLP